MDTADLLTKFARIGARVKVADRPTRRSRVPMGAISLDVQADRDGEFFEVVTPGGAYPEVAVLDVRPADRHLLLMVREGVQKHKYLCGHDERHWFVAAVPEAAPVGTVRQAKEALKPAEVRAAQAREGLRDEAGNRRKNSAYRRQGEWFFIPAPDLKVEEKLVLHDEPIARGNGGKPHWCEFCYRTGGDTVYVCFRLHGHFTEAEYRRRLEKQPEARSWGWQVMQRNAEVHVRGRVRHADHKSIVLHGWHRVLMNTEGQSIAMRNVAFLD